MNNLPPKLTRNIYRILPFGLIWLVTSWVFLINDFSISRNQNLNPDTDITLSIPVVIFASLAILILGLLVGTMEMVVLEKRFSNHRLISKIGLKFLIYLGILMGTILITYPLAGAIETGTHPFHPDIWSKFIRFFGSLTFLNTIVQLSFSLMLSLSYAAISENLGHHVLTNFLTGKYHTPKVERRIFMFADMKNSTTIAEQLGHVVYYDFLRMYYDCFSEAIINHDGEVYQYIGDEVVITWKAEDGIKNAHCLNAFYSMKENLHRISPRFEEKFGISPDFKAALHVGEATTGEIGALKKEIVFTGDVLNTTARIQSLCKKYDQDLLLSEQLVEELSVNKEFHFFEVEETLLSGKSTPSKIFGVKLRGLIS